MTICGVTIDDDRLTGFVYGGYTEDAKMSKSTNGTKREKLIISTSRKYTLELVALEKITVEQLAAALQTYSDSYIDMTVSVNGVIRGELIGYNAVNVPGTLILEFSLEDIQLENVGGKYNVKIPCKQVTYK